eukprot:TRINITY_DN67166_c0_g1_i1.p2 TRINITY_DN67166_c0_g1~~TRINITY_DN67166_c0_g1_i1.p2  ORF type:complete len:153 (-),score=32.05 TRINITY_DN67166_c0_g1_i1:43-501(-)
MCIRDRYQRRVHGLGLGVEKDTFQSQKHYMAAMSANHIPAFYKYAELIFESEIASTDTALKCLHYAYKAGNEGAGRTLVRVYREGRYVESNEVLASEIQQAIDLSLIHISEPTRPLYISYAVFCLKKKNYIYHTSIHRTSQNMRKKPPKNIS